MQSRKSCPRQGSTSLLVCRRLYQADSQFEYRYDLTRCMLVVQTDEDDRPVHPPVIHEVEVLWNPFEDIVPRSTREEREAAAAAKR